MTTTYLLQTLRCGDEIRIEKVIAEFACLNEAEKASILDQLDLLLEDPVVDFRWWAVRALAEISGPKAADLRLKALEDEDWRVRQCAAITLRLHPDPRAIALLVNLMIRGNENQEQGELTARLAADALVAIGGEAVPALITLLRSGDQAARLHAGRALAQIGDQRTIPELIKVLDDDSALLEYWASLGLEKMGVGMAFFSPE